MIIEHDFDLHRHNGYRVHAIARRVLFPESAADLEIAFTENDPARTILLGRGYNVILSRERYDDETIVILGDPFSGIEVSDDGVLTALGGTDMRSVAECAAKHALSGLEIFCDIPSSVGGAVFMNASASGQGLEPALIEVEALMLPDLTWRTFKYEQLQAGYRTSLFQSRKGVVASARFQLVPGEVSVIRTSMDRIRKSRHDKQPTDLPNAGSVFKRPQGHYVGALIEELGLKGHAVGDAMISPKHAGFIVNAGNATGAQIIALIDDIRRRVMAAHGVELELEQRVI